MNTPDEAALAEALTERLDAIVAPYVEREGDQGFPAIVEREAAEIEGMEHLSRHDLAVSVAAYRRKAADQEAITRVIMEALQGSEALRDSPVAKALRRAVPGSQTVSEAPAGRPPRERTRALAVFRELYPDGLPSEDALSNAELERRVNEVIKSKNLMRISRDTVIRARLDYAK